jgi:hypothetical protein
MEGMGAGAQGGASKREPSEGAHAGKKNFPNDKIKH